MKNVIEFYGTLYLPGLWAKYSQQIGDSHGHENHIGWRSHMLFTEDDDDEDVTNHGKNENDRHDVAVNGHRQGGRPIPC